MTATNDVPDSDRYASYSPASATTDFSVPFAVWSGDADEALADLEVRVNGAVVTTGLTFVGDFDTTANPNVCLNGIVRFATAQNGVLVEIEGAREPRRVSQYPDAAGVAPRDQNAILNAIAAAAREMRQRMARALMVPYGETVVQLPAAAERAAKFLGFDSDGNPMVGLPAGDGSLVSEAMKLVVAAATIDAALDELGATTLGKALFTAADAGAALTAMDLPDISALDSNGALMGPWQSYDQPAAPTIRNLTPYDTPKYYPSQTITLFPGSLYRKRTGRVSEYLAAGQPWQQQAAINACLAEHNVIEFDQAVYLDGTITGPLSGKRLVFLGSGLGGPSRIFMLDSAHPVMDLSGVSDLVFEGDCIVEYVQRSAAGVKAFLSTTTLTRFRAERIVTAGVDYNFYLSGAAAGVDIEALGVGNSATDAALTLLSGYTGIGTVRIGRIEGLAAVKHYTTSAITLTPFVSPRVAVYDTVIGADHTGILSPGNVVDGFEFEIIRSALSTGAFNLNVGAGSVLKALTTGTWGRFKYDAAVGWMLSAYGSL